MAREILIICPKPKPSPIATGKLWWA